MFQQCSRCKLIKSNNEFSKNKDKLCPTCKPCVRQQNKQYESTPKRKALKAWRNLNCRSGNKRGDCLSYANIEVRMTKSEFLQWAIPKYEEWFKLYPNIRPSINRIDHKGHYELTNIEMISYYRNSVMRGEAVSEQKLVDLIVKKCSVYLLDPVKIANMLLSQQKSLTTQSES